MLAMTSVFVLTVLSSLIISIPGITATVAVGLESLSNDDIIDALGGLVQNFSAFITLESFITNLMSIEFTAQNTLILEMTLDTVSCLAGVNNTAFASFTRTFDPPLVIPILGTADSGTIDNVLLVQGAIDTLTIIPFGELDILDMNVTVHAATIDGAGGIPLSLNGLMQSDVPTAYDVETFTV